MKSKLLLAGSFLLIVALLLCGCVGTAPTAGTPAATPTAQVVTKEVPAEYSIMNPRPSRPPIMASALAPRLSSLAGKTIAVVANYNGTMAPIAEALPKVASGVKVLFISDMEVARGQSPRPITLDAPGVTNMSLKDFEKDPKIANAVITGNGF
jgi:hypothetical protein